MPRYTIDALTALACRALERAGANAEMARITANALVAAEARGLASHGVARVIQYATHLRNGRADGEARPRIVRRHGATALVDAGSGLAFPACALGVESAIDLAREHDGRRVAVVCHGGVLAALYRLIHDIPVAKPHAIPIANASYNALAFEADAWSVEAWGDVAHLPAVVPFVES